MIDLKSPLTRSDTIPSEGAGEEGGFRDVHQSSGDRCGGFFYRTS